ncbi:uncharacterized protein UTRI_00552 [Ustilago trichophora]|uniref:Ubiquitin-like domain-containing protein n=1 Tax=Ustilago trichophora TaxID=86804 RepID=A0A5C3DRT2_9BASI|nr:uncharacterized protein UTRI_00552 [Ustilago trichophora]
MDDDVDFFTRKPPPVRSKSKPKALAKAVNDAARNAGEGSSRITQPPSSAHASSAPTSTSAAGQLVTSDDRRDEVDMLEDDLDEEDEEDDAVLLSSDEEIASDDSDASAKRRAKRRKKRHARTLPAWASQGVYRRPSQEPSSSGTAVFSDAVLSSSRSDGVTTSASQKANASDGTNNKSKGNGRTRGVSLTPPPPPSPEKLSMARELVNRTIASKFGSSATSNVASSTISPPSSSTDSASLRATRSTRASATSAFGQDVAQSASSALSPSARRHNDDEDLTSQIHWDPDLARLIRGENAKHIREQAKREQQERDERRKQRELERIRQQPSSLPGSSQRQGQFARTQSAPQTRSTAIRVADDGDSDDSVEFVPRLSRPSTSPRRTRSSTASQPKKEAVIVIDDSDDDGNISKRNPANGTAHSPSPPPATAEPEGEKLSLTLQSKLGSLSVTVTPTTKLLTIINHFHKQKLNDAVKPESIRLTFDGFGYKPEQTVADMDVEDGDQVELSWT